MGKIVLAGYERYSRNSNSNHGLRILPAQGALAQPSHLGNTGRVVANKTLETKGSQLCLQCGLCCDGSVFATVRLQPADDPEHLRQAGLTLRGPPTSRRFAQPCPMLEGCRCRIYPQRPSHCQTFDCALLKRLRQGKVSLPEAAREVHGARRLVEAVRGKLRALGDPHENQPIATRVRRTGARLAKGGANPEALQLYSQLTLAAHRMNLRLSRSFYPGSP